MRAALAHLAALEHEHLVGGLERREPVGDQQDPARARLEQVGDDRVGGGDLEVLAGLVEDQQREVGEQRARDRQPLALAAGHRAAALADLGLQSPRQRVDPVEQPCPARARSS